MEVHLTAEQQSFIEEAVRAGRFASAEDALREAVALLEVREHALAEIRVSVQEGLDDLDAGRFEDYTSENIRELFDSVKRRGRLRLSAERAS